MYSRYSPAITILLVSLLLIIVHVSVDKVVICSPCYETSYATSLEDSLTGQEDASRIGVTEDSTLPDESEVLRIDDSNQSDEGQPQVSFSSLSNNNTSNATELNSTTLSNDLASDRLKSTSPSGPYSGALQIPYTGLARFHLTPDNTKLFGLGETKYAILVTEVEPGSPAEKAGIKGGVITTTVAGDVVKVGGDIILKLDGNSSYVRNNRAFLNFIQDEKAVGENVTLTILRDGQVKDVEMNIGAMPIFLGYENKDEGIKLRYPSDWRVSESGLSKQDIVKFFSREAITSNGSSLPVAGIFLKIGPSSVGLDSVARSEQEDTSTSRILSLVPIEISGLPGYEKVFYDYSNTYRTLKILEAFTIKDDQLYTIQFATDPTRYDDYFPLAREMIKSFQFTK